ncbi:MAG: hypothetical protein AAFX10_04325 [Pseudomonadota bacterium]
MGLIVRLLPVAFVAMAAAAWFNDVQDGGPWVARNLAPVGVVLVLAVLTLYRGGGRWTGSGYRLPLGTLGFAVPALGLSTYMHYAYSINLNGMFDGGAGDFFRFLPMYTAGAGAIGFAIGWIIGRNV